MKPWVRLLAVAIVLTSLSARADELKLKDGTKIVGTIVGFEDDSFKVKTRYGFALVQKDQVAAINMGEGAKAAEPPKASSGTPTEAPKPADPSSASPRTTPPNAQPTVTATKPSAVAPGAGSIREQVVGNLYTNETYGFRMFKPPTWEVIAGVPSVLPGAVAAMGTSDQATYLLVGQEPAGPSVENVRNATQRRLSDILANFRALGESSVAVAGVKGIEIRFRGGVDEHDWSGEAVFVEHGGRLFTIFGMTVADSDLVQIQENVIGRVVASIEFTK